jgi:hypothetical protein
LIRGRLYTHTTAFSLHNLILIFKKIMLALMRRFQNFSFETATKTVVLQAVGRETTRACEKPTGF